MPITDFRLNFTFTQGEGASGRITAGTLTATIIDWVTGQTIWTETAAESANLPLNGASCDDAFPLLSRGSPTLLSIISSNPPPSSHPSWNCVTWNLPDFEPNGNQTGVIMHPGNSPAPNGQVSGNSESCLVVSESHFLDPLDKEIINLAGLPATTSLTTLSAWINNNLTTAMTTDISVTQSQLDLLSPGDDPGTFQFQMTRPLEKNVMAIYSETDLSNGDQTAREAVLPSTPTGAQTSAVFDPATDMDTPVTTQPGDPNILKLLQDTPNLKGYASVFDATYSVNPGDQFAIRLLGYEVQYGGSSSNTWYFDGKGNPNVSSPSFNLDSEGLMYDNAHISVTV